MVAWYFIMQNKLHNHSPNEKFFFFSFEHLFLNNTYGCTHAHIWIYTHMIIIKLKKQRSNSSNSSQVLSKSWTSRTFHDKLSPKCSYNGILHRTLLLSYPYHSTFQFPSQHLLPVLIILLINLPDCYLLPPLACQLVKGRDKECPHLYPQRHHTVPRMENGHNIFVE